MRVDGVLAWWSPDRRGSFRSRCFTSVVRCDGSATASRSASTASRPSCERARIGAGRTAGSTSRSSPRTAACTCSGTCKHRGVVRRRARGRFVRTAARAPLRGRVDVPPRDECVEGRALGRGRTLADKRRDVVRRAVDDTALAFAGRNPRVARHVFGLARGSGSVGVMSERREAGSSERGPSGPARDAGRSDRRRVEPEPTLGRAKSGQA